MTEHKSTYSIVIQPPVNGIEYVKQLKNELSSTIGWYNSRNSEAHVTIMGFSADEDELLDIIRNLKEISSYENPIHLSFNGVDRYPNGAVFLKPIATTKIATTVLMDNIQKQMLIKKSDKSRDPHISIGRKLSEDHVSIALNILANAKLEFDCANLVLRKFNPDKKQYELFSNDFKFKGLPAKPEAQQSLF